MNKQTGFFKVMSAQKTQKVLLAVSVVVFSLVMSCPQASAAWEDDGLFDIFFTYPTTTQKWRHNGEPPGVPGVGTNWCLALGSCCLGVGPTPFVSNPELFDINITLINGERDTAVIVTNAREIEVWSNSKGLLGKAVDGGGTPVTGFTFAELGNIDGDANTDLFCLVGDTDVSWYEHNPVTNNFEVVSVHVGSGYRHGSVGYLNNPARNQCIITDGTGVEFFEESPAGSGTFTVTGSPTNLGNLATNEGTTWKAMSLGHVDYDDFPDLILLGVNGIIYWTEWDGVSDFTLQTSHAEPGGGAYLDVAVGSDILKDGIGDIFAPSNTLGIVHWILHDGAGGLLLQETICGSGYLRVGPERDDSLVPVSLLDVTAPTVQMVVAVDPMLIDITFDEVMGASVLNPANYTLSGTGQGSLGTNPDSVTDSGGNTYRLTWNSGSQLLGGDVTITVTSVFDLRSNPIDSPNSGTGISVAVQDPSAPGGGVYILMDDFDGPPNTTNPDGNFWGGSCGVAECEREAIEYIRGGAVPPMNGDAQWEVWSACCSPAGGSGAEVNKDGNGNLTMQMLFNADPNTGIFQSYVDARNNPQTTDNSHSYTVMSIMTLPSNGSGGMFFGFSTPAGGYSKGIKMIGGSIYWTNSNPADWAGTAGDTDTGATYTPGTEIGVAFHIETDGSVTIHTSSPPSKDASIGWTEVPNNPSALYVHESEEFSLHTIAAASNLANDLCVVDFIGWIEDSPRPAVPVELSEFSLE
jgi:hypothetical protein